MTDQRSSDSVEQPKSEGQLHFAPPIQHGIFRKVKHVSMIVCISVAGESLTPYIMISQDSPSVREQLKKHGVRLGTDVIVKSNGKPYINA
jgi:hypothetical protein